MLADAAATVGVAFTLAVFLALVNERLIEYFVAPIFDQRGWSQYILYVSLATGALISLAFGIDLFGPMAAALDMQMIAPWAGYILTAITVGGGSNLLHDLWPEEDE